MPGVLAVNGLVFRRNSSPNATKNKNMIRKSIKYALLSGVLLGAAGILTCQASSTIITFSVDMATNIANGSFNPPAPGGTGTNVVYARGTFDGWASPGLPLTEVGNTTVFTNSYNDTGDAYVVTYLYDVDGNDEGTGDYDNRAAFIPATSGASLMLPTQWYNDVGPGSAITATFQVDMSEEIELGHFHPANGDTVVIAASFNGWSPTAGSQYVLTNNPSIVVTNNNFNPATTETNVYTAIVTIASNSEQPGIPATNSLEEWKYVEEVGGNANWENPGPTTADGNGNRFLVANTNQTLPLVSFSDLPYAPLANLTLNVDMSGVIFSDPNYVPNSVVVWGTFNNWAGGVNLTNNPSANNTNIYSTVLSVGEGSSILYQVRYTNSVINNFVYDFIDDEVYNNNFRRTIQLPITSTILNTNLPVFYFNDLAVGDYLPVATPVLFSVDMNGAVGTDSHVFTAGDGLYINGMFADGGGYPQAWYPWGGGPNPVPAPAGFQMIQQGSTTIYTNTIILPAGTPVVIQYQYGIDPGGANLGPLEDELASGSNHSRVVRSTAENLYSLPTDTFGNAYQEPVFSTGNTEDVGSLSGGNLTAGTPSAGKIPVSWLGRPGAHLQVSTNVTGSSWQDLPATDGTNWTTGYSSTNGFVSVTNWPAGGNSFFRLVKP